jgi:hypothetical protein
MQAQRQAIKQAVDDAKEEGFPASAEEKEAYFLEQVQAGEIMGADRTFFCRCRRMVHRGRGHSLTHRYSFQGT